VKESELVSLTQIERLLELACVYNVPLTVTAESDEMTYRYKSRMFEIERTQSTPRLVIDHPVTDGPAIALVPNTRINVFFALDNDHFCFESRIFRKVSFTLANKRVVSAYEITYPNVLKSGQRRLFYRVPVPQGKPISVECGVIGERTDWFAQEPGTWNFPTQMGFEGRILNVSVGGMLLGVKKSGAFMPMIGTKLGMRFALKSDESSLSMKGIVRRVEERPSGEETALGIEFIDIGDKFEYKLAINRLYRYVADRQREVLAIGLRKLEPQSDRQETKSVK
jgi:c-di-GMP-binding flagellar brake protein YcgR